MSYMKIPNLYKDQTVLEFKKVWVTEKIHGTSAWITFRNNQLLLHPGGAKMEKFAALFDEDSLKNKLYEIFGDKVIKIHGEHYGGKIQKMSNTYGKSNNFVVFEIKVGDVFLSFDKVQDLCKTLNLEVVYGEIIDCNVDTLNKHRDMMSIQAKRNGIEEDRPREGIVIRPLTEYTKNNGDRVIAKHKGENFKETKTQREVTPEKLQILKEAQAIAEEWVTHMRLMHVLDKIDNPGMKNMREIISAMTNDIEVEGKDEIVMTNDTKKQIGKKTAFMFKGYLQKELEAKE